MVDNFDYYGLINYQRQVKGFNFDFSFLELIEVFCLDSMQSDYFRSKLSVHYLVILGIDSKKVNFRRNDSIFKSWENHFGLELCLADYS